MSFDLFVYGAAIDTANRGEMQAQFYDWFARAGLRAQWHPEFDVTANFASASIPFKLEIDPEYVPEWECYGSGSLVSVVHLGRRRHARFDSLRRAPWNCKATLLGAPWQYSLTTSAGRNPLDFRLQMTFAASLCMAVDGILLDPQNERGYFPRRNAMKHLFMQARAYDVTHARERPDGWDLPRFTAWPTLEVT